MIIIKGSKDTLEGLLKQIEMYEDLVELLKKEKQLLEEGEDITEIKEEQRELRDEIKKIDLEYDIKRSDKLRLVNENDIDKLNKFKPILKELYDLDKKTKKLSTSS